MTEDTYNITPLSDTADVVQAWRDLVLFTDASGIVTWVEGEGLDYLPRSGESGIPFWEALALKGRNLEEVLDCFPPQTIHEISCCDGRSFVLRVIGLGKERGGGFIIIATDNRPMETLYESYEERLEDNISAWSDSITLFNALFETAKDATFLIDEQGVILAANAAAADQHGAGERSLTGHDCLDLVGNRYRSDLKQAMQNVKARQVWTEKLAGVDGDGDSFPAEAILRKVQFSDYSLYQLILHDLSKQMELREDLRDKEAEIEKMGIALRQVIRSVEEERQELRDQITSQVKKQVLPALERIAREKAPEIREGYRSVIEEQLVDMTGDSSGELDAELLRLSPREMEVCQLVQIGKSGKEIAELLNMSFETVQTHRKNIRRKLGLRGSRTTLSGYLRHKPSLM
jgi:PAS domain S-box-containing protein